MRLGRNFLDVFFEPQKLVNFLLNRRAPLLASAPLSTAPSATIWRRHSEVPWGSPEITELVGMQIPKPIIVGVASFERYDFLSGPEILVFELWRQWPRESLIDSELSAFQNSDFGIWEFDQKWVTYGLFFRPHFPLNLSFEIGDYPRHPCLIGICQRYGQNLRSRIPHWANFYNSTLDAHHLLSLKSSLLLNLIIRFVHRSELASSNAGINCGSNESTKYGKECAKIKHNLPPWRFVMAAFVGIFGGWWGWWNLRRERRQIAATFVFLIGTCFWVYAVHGLLIWGIQF
jgi:hypothetical protein